MQKVEKNENGYALIIVLLVIIIIAIMTPPIISKIMSSSKQFQTIEENLQLEKLGDMGILYTEKAVEDTRTKAESNARNIIFNKYRDIPEHKKPSQSQINAEFQELFMSTFRNKLKEYYTTPKSNCKSGLSESDKFFNAPCVEVNLETNRDNEKQKHFKYKVAYIEIENFTFNYRVNMTVRESYSDSEYISDDIVISIPNY